jgi:hypothetical protein
VDEKLAAERGTRITVKKKAPKAGRCRLTLSNPRLKRPELKRFKLICY